MGLPLKRAAMKSYSRGSYAAAFSIPGGGTLSIHRALTQAWPVLPGLVAPAMQENVPGTEQRLRGVRNCHCANVKCVSSSSPLNKNSGPCCWWTPPSYRQKPNVVEQRLLQAVRHFH